MNEHVKDDTYWRSLEQETSREPLEGSDLIKAAAKKTRSRPKRESNQTPTQPEWARRAVVDGFDIVNRDDKGNIRQNLDNAIVAVGYDPVLAECFAFDEIAREVIVTIRAAGIVDGPRPLTEHDVIKVTRYLQRLGFPKLPKDMALDAIKYVANVRAFNPVRDWLDSLTWDKVERMSGFLSTYFGTEYNEYHENIGAMFLVAMVKRIYEPGCQCDYALVLEGGQGAGKSSACRILAGDRYFSDSLPRLGGDEKRISMHLRGKWLIEIAELASMKRSEVEDIKAFITRRVENYLPSYAKVQVNEPRTCVFVATTNDERYLKDDTGERRFWPAKVGVIDLEALERDRDQLFAEAADKMRDGYKHWPDHTFEERWIKPEQAKRKVVDPREEIVAAWAVKLPYGRDRLTGREIAAEALGLGPDRFDPVIGKIVGRGMRTARWLSDHTKTGTIWTRAAVRVKQ